MVGMQPSYATNGDYSGLRTRTRRFLAIFRVVAVSTPGIIFRSISGITVNAATFLQFKATTKYSGARNTVAKEEVSPDETWGHHPRRASPPTLHRNLIIKSAVFSVIGFAWLSFRLDRSRRKVSTIRRGWIYRRLTVHGIIPRGNSSDVSFDFSLDGSFESRRGNRVVFEETR